jgi:hypothetical protein
MESFSAVVIFITAYPERFLTATAVPKPAFLIAKPFKPQQVVSLITSSLFFKRAASLASSAPLPGANHSN